MSQTLSIKARQNVGWLKIPVVLLPILLIAIQWVTYERLTNDLVLDVPQLVLIPQLETNWLYMFLHIFSFIPVFALSFDKRVHYYQSWKYLVPATLIVAAIFIIWDVIFTAMYVWQFNPTYYLGIKLLGLPIEEWLFFVVIPFASIFIYECLNAYIPKDLLAPFEKSITICLIVGFLAGGLIYWEKVYTSTTFLLTGGFVLYHFLFLPSYYRARFYFSFLVILIPFLLVDGVLTGGYTNAPIVLYNPLEYLGFRVLSLPFEDIVYGFLMLMGIVSIMEHWRNKVEG